MISWSDAKVNLAIDDAYTAPIGRSVWPANAESLGTQRPQTSSTLYAWYQCFRGTLRCDAPPLSNLSLRVLEVEAVIHRHLCSFCDQKQGHLARRLLHADPRWRNSPSLMRDITASFPRPARAACRRQSSLKQGQVWIMFASTATDGATLIYLRPRSCQHRLTPVLCT